MAGFMNPMSEDPMRALEMAAAARMDGSGSNPSPMPGPMPISGPAQPAAPAAVPPASASPGIGDRIGNALAGRGFFGDGKSDQTLDPSTGVPKGMIRESNMQSIMKMGLMLVAAGSRQSDDSRAALLAKIPDMVGNSDQINNFAKTRLDMAKMKLAERQQAQSEAQSEAVKLMIARAGGAPAEPSANAAPAPALPTAAGLTAAQGGGLPGGTGTPPAAGAPMAPSGAPAMPTSATVRPPMPPTAPPLSQEEQLALRAMPPSEVPGYLMKRRATFVESEYAGPEYIDPDTNSKMRDIYKLGKKVRSEKLGEVQGEAGVTEINGQKFISKSANGKTTSLQQITETPSKFDDEMAKEYVKMNTTVRNGAAAGRSMKKLIGDIEAATENPDVYFGTGGKKVMELKKALGSIGLTGLDGVADAELATKATNQLALKMRDPDGEFGGLPGATSNRDLSFLLDSVPGLNQTRDGAKLVAQGFRKIAEMQIGADKLRLDYLKKNKVLDTGFEVELNDYYEKHQLLTEEERAKISALAAKTPAGPVPDGAAAKAGVSGQTKSGLKWSIAP